jgi:acetyl/propionyl-CoA carboxylase alpha subunit
VSGLVLDCVLVADRGVAAVRVLRALQHLGVKAVSLHSEADATALHATLADESVLIGPTTASYGDTVKVVEAARQAGAEGVHPVTADVPGLQEAVLAAGLEWLGEPLQVPVVLTVAGGAVEAVLSDALAIVPPVASRSAEVVTGLDLTCASLTGEASGVARGGLAVSIDVLGSELAPVTRMQVPHDDDLWVDAAVEVGTEPVDPLLAVLTAWGPDRDAAYLRARQAWEQLIIEGPLVPRPAALGGDSP